MLGAMAIGVRVVQYPGFLPACMQLLSRSRALLLLRSVVELL